MKKIIVLSIISLVVLTGCKKNNLWIMDSFFDNKLLKQEEVEDLPKPPGIIKAFYKGYGFTNPEVLVDASLVSGDYASMYAKRVLEYLKEKSFKYLYSVGTTNMYNTPLVSKYAYNLKEAVDLKDFIVEKYYSGGYIFDNPYVFVFSNKGFIENDNKDKELESPHCIIISREGSYTTEVNNQDISYSYTVELDLHSSYWWMEG